MKSNRINQTIFLACIALLAVLLIQNQQKQAPEEEPVEVVIPELTLQQKAADGSEEAQLEFALQLLEEHNVNAAIEWLNKAVSNNHPETWFELGNIYKSNAAYLDYSKAHEAFSKAAELGHPEAMYEVGALMLLDTVPEPNADITSVYKLAYDGNPESMYLMGKALREQKGNLDPQQGIHWLEQAAEAGHSNAQVELAHCYLYGRGVPQNPLEGIDWLEIAAASGHSQAQLELAKIYYNGKLITSDHEKAFKLFEKTAAKEIAEGIYGKGAMLFEGHGTIRDYEKALEQFTLAAKQNHGKAQAMLGFMYAQGQGVELDYNQAIRYLKLAASQNIAMAEGMLGHFYKEGHAVPSDLQQAVYWLERASKHGSNGAQFTLAKMYQEGLGMRKDVKKALELYEKSSYEGNPHAQALLGMIYWKGEDVKQDNVEAFAWLNIASMKLPDASNVRDEIASQLNEEELPLAEEMSEELLKKIQRNSKIATATRRNTMPHTTRGNFPPLGFGSNISGRAAADTTSDKLTTRVSSISEDDAASPLESTVSFPQTSDITD